MFTDIKYYSHNLSEHYVVGVYSSEEYEHVILYDEDFGKLQNNSWLNGVVIDALLLIFVNKEIGYVSVNISNSIWSWFNWIQYRMLFLPINPKGNHWTLFIMDFILGRVFYSIICIQNQVICTYLT